MTLPKDENHEHLNGVYWETPKPGDTTLTLGVAVYDLDEKQVIEQIETVYDKPALKRLISNLQRVASKLA